MKGSFSLGHGVMIEKDANNLRSSFPVSAIAAFIISRQRAVLLSADWGYKIGTILRSGRRKIHAIQSKTDSMG
jgi:hypothetical protein